MWSPRLFWRLCFIVFLGLSVNGCFLNAVLSRVTVTTIGKEVDRTFAAIEASASVAICADLEDFPGVPVSCTYVIGGKEITSTFELISELGLFGILIDPIILQVPEAATSFGGTYSGTTTSGNLVISEVVGSLPADLDREIVPEPGTKLVIVEFPDPPPPLDNEPFGYNLDFELPGNVTPIPIKALFAARIDTNGQTFYPPLYPCETDFANVPQLLLQESALFQDVDLAPIVGAQGCDGTVYRLSSGSEEALAIPTASRQSLVLLVAALLMLGLAILRRGAPP